MNQTNELTLPPVAKSFYTLCKKCEADRYHKVLAHTTTTSAKIECEVCKSRKTYSLPKAGGAVRKTGTAAARAGVARKNSHTGEYELRTQKQSEKTATPYSIKSKYSENEKIQHVKFGVGFVQKTYDEKIDVIFVDEVKSLIQNRK